MVMILVLEANCISMQPEPKPYFTTDTKAGDSHRLMFSGYYICKIMVVIACS